MTHVLIIGAHGEIAQLATRLFLARDDIHLTLYLRRVKRLNALAQHPRARLVEGDALDVEQLKAVMPGHDAVYANLAGPMGRQAKAIVKAMQASGLRRLVFISSMGSTTRCPASMPAACSTRIASQRPRSRLPTLTTPSCGLPGWTSRTSWHTGRRERASRSARAARRFLASVSRTWWSSFARPPRCIGAKASAFTEPEPFICGP